tara:strand:+ start:5264 stop:5998 length:735 start_codon:yes stop_codon:yes gene_type:complete
MKIKEILKNSVKDVNSVIIDEGHKIDVAKTSQQVLKWVGDNVEQFIDNQRRTFKLDLFVGEESHDDGELSELKKLQDLYAAIPDIDNIDDEDLNELSPDLVESDTGKTFPQLSKHQNEVIKSASETRRELDEITKLIYEQMQEETELLEHLFKRMVFYYELRGISQGVPLIEELEGGVEVIQFEYEAFTVAVSVSKPAVHAQDEDGNIAKVEEKAQTSYTIPEGFTIWVEISHKPKALGLTSIF